jgi:hypothetical protein
VIACAATPLGGHFRIKTPRRCWLCGRRPVFIIQFDYSIWSLPNSTFIHARMLPELARDLDRVDTEPFPPRSLVARAMNRAVMYPA